MVGEMGHFFQQHHIAINEYEASLCYQSIFSSRICELGTKGCIIVHANEHINPLDYAGPEPDDEDPENL